MSRGSSCSVHITCVATCDAQAGHRYWRYMVLTFECTTWQRCTGPAVAPGESGALHLSAHTSGGWSAFPKAITPHLPCHRSYAACLNCCMLEGAVTALVR